MVAEGAGIGAYSPPCQPPSLWNPLTWDYRQFATGWGSAFINISITYPINKVIFRQMLHNLPPATAIRQLSSEGLFTLYRGILPPLCQKTTSLSLMFGVYEGTLRPLGTTLPPHLAKVTAAMIAGTAEAVLAPFERVQTLLQDRRYEREFANTRDAFRKIVNSYGRGEFYRGLVPILLRNGPSNVCYFFLRDEAKSRLQGSTEKWYSKMTKDFICGGVIGGMISTVFYPINVIKVHMQSKLGGPYESVAYAARQMYESRGRCLSCFYRGVHLNYTRGFISWGVITVSSEAIQKFLS